MPDWIRVVIALAGCIGLSLVGVKVVRVLLMPAPPDEPDLTKLQPMDLHYRCMVCGTEVTMTAAPDADTDAPRHCREDMALVATTEAV